ncbi:hypothetical protein L218DRAFT_63584 [Marasmius fiardii PR-910]|nr:hypothetical protein L218DRAFT_63584 [Marasmius fiardii PR-910]
MAEGFEVTAQVALEATTLAVDGQTNEAMRTIGEGMDRVSKGTDELASETRSGEAKPSQSKELDEAERREATIETLREILLAAHHDRPDHIVALRSILTVGENIIEGASKTPTSSVEALESRVEISPEIPPSLRLFSVPSSSSTRCKPRATDQLLKTTISDLKELLQRLAGGKSFDGVIEAFRQVVEDLDEDRVRSDGEAEVDVHAAEGKPLETTHCTEENVEANLIKSSVAILKQAVENPAYVEGATNDGISAFTSDMDNLMECWTIAAQERHHQPDSDNDPHPPSTSLPLPQRQRHHLHTFIIELSSFIGSLENDKPTAQLMNAFKSLEADFLDYFSETSVSGVGSSAAHLGTHYLRFITDVIGHVLPRIVGNALSPSSSPSAFALPLPLPRVEVKTPSLESVADMRGMVVNADVEKRKRWWELWDNGVEEEEEYWWGDRSRWSTAREASWSEAPSESIMEDSMYSTVTPASSVLGGRDPNESNWFANFLTPRSVSVKRSEEVVIDFSREEGVVDEQNERTPLIDSSTTRKRYGERCSITTSTSTSSRAHVKMDGLFVGLPISTTSSRRQKTRTISFENISYYVNYTLWWLLGYRDDGILDIDVTLNDTENGEEGGVVDMDIEINLGSATQQMGKGLKILSLVLSLPRNIHIDVLLSSNGHPFLTSSVLNPLVIPFSQHIARAEAERVAGETLRSILEEGGNRILDVLGAFSRKSEGEDDRSWCLTGSFSPFGAYVLFRRYHILWSLSYPDYFLFPFRPIIHRFLTSG